jgi:hypothetical protein
MIPRGFIVDKKKQQFLGIFSGNKHLVGFVSRALTLTNFISIEQ